MQKFKIFFYNIIFLIIFFPIFDVVVSNFILKVDTAACFKIEKHFYELKKNCSGRHLFKSSFPVVKVKTDNYGLRTNRIKNKESQKQKILFFGDSMTFGVGIEYENTFVGLLEDKFVDYDFYNFGVGSYSPTVHLYKLEKAIENKLIPKKIILLLDLSDIADESKRWQNTKDSSRPSLTYDTSAIWKTKKKITHKNFQVSRLITSKINYNLRILRNKIMNIKKSKNQKSTVKTSIQGNFTYTNLDDLDTRYWSKKSFKKGVKKIKNKITQISLISKKYNSEFYLVIYPWGETLVHGQGSFNWENFGQELCMQDKCTLINTFPEFRIKKNNDKFWYSNLYFIGDEHLNSKGNLFLAEILGKKIFSK